MRNFIIFTLLAFTSLSAFAQEANISTPETITVGETSEVKNTEGVYTFLGNLDQQNKELTEMREITIELQKQIEADKNWNQDEENNAQHADNMEIIEACEQMLATNKRIMEGKVTIRSVDAQQK